MVHRVTRVELAWPARSPSLRDSAQRRGDVGHLLDEAKCPGYAPEAVVLVEGGRVLVDRVDDDEPRSDCLSSRKHAREPFGDQCPAESLAVERLVER